MWDYNESLGVASLHSSSFSPDTGHSRIFTPFTTLGSHLFGFVSFHYGLSRTDTAQRGLLRFAYGRAEFDDVFSLLFTTFGLLCMIPDQGFGAGKGPFHLINDFFFFFKSVTTLPHLLSGPGQK